MRRQAMIARMLKDAHTADGYNIYNWFDDRGYHQMVGTQLKTVKLNFLPKVQPLATVVIIRW